MAKAINVVKKISCTKKICFGQGYFFKNPVLKQKGFHYCCFGDSNQLFSIYLACKMRMVKYGKSKKQGVGCYLPG